MRKVKRVCEKTKTKPAFTIIELLTVMSIIVILIGLLVPALTRVKRYARLVRQKAQFHSIGVALDLFSSEYDGYPDSDQLDGRIPPEVRVPYCGAMKLAEAMVGQDFKGFHPDSRFRRDGLDGPGGANLYPYPAPAPASPQYPAYLENLRARHMYLQLENANAYTLDTIYAPADIAAIGFEPNDVVLCDVYNRVKSKKTAKGIGMPILYYRADPANIGHVISTDDNVLESNIYDVQDNQALINLGLPWSAAPVHPMASDGTTSTGAVIGLTLPAWPGLFYEKTLNPKVPTNDRPYRADSYLLLSAGFDGEYGTSDDIWNFGE